VLYHILSFDFDEKQADRQADRKADLWLVVHRVGGELNRVTCGGSGCEKITTTAVHLQVTASSTLLQLPEGAKPPAGSRGTASGGRYWVAKPHKAGHFRHTWMSILLTILHIHINFLIGKVRRPVTLTDAGGGCIPHPSESAL